MFSILAPDLSWLFSTLENGLLGIAVEFTKRQIEGAVVALSGL